MTLLGADRVRTLDGAALRDDALTLKAPDGDPARAVVTAVVQPLLLDFAAPSACGRSILILGGGGYVELMAGREGVAVARWLNGLGYDAHVLIHRFPNAATGPAAPIADAMAAMRLLRGEARSGVGVVGLSSGGHLAAALAARMPAQWGLVPDRATRPDMLVIGYAPISTNAAGRTIVADKPPLMPLEKQALYDAIQPDAAVMTAPPPCFIAYSRNDPVVPVDNARRLADAWAGAGGEAELHIFADAPHGFALDTPDGPVTLWPQLCAAWLKQIGFA